MKTKLHLLISCCMILFALVMGSDGYSQINYTQNFNVDEGGWDDFDFYPSTFQACEGMSFSGEFYLYDYGDGEVYTGNAETISPAIGVSNGLPVTFSYSYKVFDYWNYEPLSNAFDWGTVTVAYSASASGPWTTIHTINSSNTTSTDCTVKTATFTPPTGTSVYIKVTGTPGAGEFIDVLFSLDNVSLIQQLPACTGTPGASTAILLNGPVCNQQNASVALTPAYGASGLTYQWQGSPTGVTYTNIAGATSATLSAPLSAGPYFRAVVTCSGSSASVTSAAVQATGSGVNCTTCTVAFTSNVEPITSVVFSNLTNTSDASATGAPAMQDFTALPAANVTTGQAYTFSAQGNSDGSYTNYFKVFIDFNKNGNLNDPGESFQIGSIYNSNGTDGITASAPIFIPTNASAGITLMRVFKLYSAYPASPCGTSGFGYGQVEDYQVNITPCTTVAPTATATQTVCPGATVANLTATGTVVKWYTVASGGTALTATTALTNNTTYYASQTVGCEGSARVAVAVNFTVIPIDDPADVTACNSYTLPALTNGVYRTATAGGGTVVAAGTAITASTTLYVYNTVGTCTAENSFFITISNPVANAPADVVSCTPYTLPALTQGSYRTATAGGGTALAAGTVISETTTLYVFAGSATCFNEHSFTVTVYNTVADDPADVSSCGTYVLPALTNGAYHTEAGGQGDVLAAGDVVNATATLYVYAAQGTSTTTCSAENAFTVTITNADVDELDDVTACGSYTLPEITNGVYYTGGSGLGDMLEAGDVITQTSTIHIYNAVSATCTAESSFTVTVVTLEADELEDATVYCNGYTLPELSAGNDYYSGPGGTGDIFDAGAVITTSQTIYIYTQSATCTAETSFAVTVNEVDAPTGEEATIVEADVDGAYPPLYSIEVEAEGTVIWYATEEDALAGTNPLSEDFLIEEGSHIYYATQTIDGCESDPFAIAIDTFVLGRVGFDSKAFSYYPNPTSDVLNISYSETITSFTLYDLLGKKVISKSVNNSAAQIDLSALAAGTYVGKVETENGSKTFKVIKNK